MSDEGRSDPDPLAHTSRTVSAPVPRPFEEPRAAPVIPRPGATLNIVRGPGIQEPVTIELTKDTTVVGRHPSSDVVLNDPTVSRHHIELRRSGGEVVITDLGSLNGTYVNRIAMDRRVLADGDMVWVGRYRLLFRSGEREAG